METKRAWMGVMAAAALAASVWAQAPAPNTRGPRMDVPSNDNYLSNPGFEEGMKDWWPWMNPNGTVSIDDKVFHSGKKSLRIDVKPDFDRRQESYTFATGTIGDILTPGKTYTVSGWIMIGNVPAGQKGPTAALFEASGIAATQSVQGPTDPAKNDGWVFVSSTFKYPKTGHGYALRAWCDMPQGAVPGTVWFDDLKFEEGSVPTAFRLDSLSVTDFYGRDKRIYWFPVPVDYRVSMEVVTPHVEMCEPSAGPKLRALWAGFFYNARVAAELAERADLAMDSVVFNGGAHEPAGSDTIHEKCIAVYRERMGTDPKLDMAHSPQVLILEQSALDLFARQDREDLLDRVRQGMGCVILLGASRGPLAPTPKVKEIVDGAAKMTEEGRGRVVTTPHPLAHWGDGTYNIEAAYSETLKAVYQSVGAEPAAVKAGATPQKPEANEAWTARIQGEAAQARVRIVPDLPTPDFNYIMAGHGVAEPRTVVAEAAADLTEGAASISMQPLPPGNYMFLAQLLDKEKRVLGWSLDKLQVVSPVTITKLEIGGADALTANRQASAICAIRNDGPATDGFSVSAQILDPLGRVLAQAGPSPAVSLKKGDTTFNLPFSLSHAELCSAKVRVQVKDSRKMTVAQSETWISTEAMMTPVDFNIGPYDDYCDGWRALGADLMCDYRSVPVLGLRPVPWLDIFRFIGKDSSMTDPAALQRVKQYVTEYAKVGLPLHDFGCILHDEASAFGFNPDKPTETDAAYFRQYLKEAYKTIQALNASWGTAYRDWSEIMPDPARKINPVTLDKGNPAPWADWNAACEQATYRFYTALDQAMREVFPPDGLKMGPSGTRDTTGTNGLDWWLMTKAWRSVHLYGGIHDEMYRSFKTADNIMRQWSHLYGVEDPDYTRTRAWTDTFEHHSGTLTYGGRFTNLFYPDYRPEPGTVGYAEELAALRNGFGRLILGAKYDDRTAIFFSPACCRARIIEDKNFSGSAAQNDGYYSLWTALADMRIGTRFVSYEQVTHGDVTPQTAQVLFLWHALALTEPEAAAIRRYVNNGGVVMADVEPGTYDEHCHKLPEGRLRDLMPASGMTRLVGQGKFILFAGLPVNYAGMQGYGEGGEASKAVKSSKADVTAKFLALLTAEAGVKQPFRITDMQDREINQDFDAYYYVDGAARYAGCMPFGKYGETLKARLTIPGNGHLYECRTGKYLGTDSTHEVELRRAMGNLFALLPYKVEAIQLTAPPTATPGQPIHVKAALQTGPGAPVRHVLVIQLRRPDGKELPVNRWVLETMNRSVEADLFLALNDPSGKWTLAVRDTATGVRREQPLEVRADGAALQNG